MQVPSLRKLQNYLYILRNSNNSVSPKVQTFKLLIHFTSLFVLDHVAPFTSPHTASSPPSPVTPRHRSP